MSLTKNHKSQEIKLQDLVRDYPEMEVELLQIFQGFLRNLEDIASYVHGISYDLEKVARSIYSAKASLLDADDDKLRTNVVHAAYDINAVESIVNETGVVVDIMRNHFTEEVSKAFVN